MMNIKQKKVKIEPRIKLNYNKSICILAEDFSTLISNGGSKWEAITDYRASLVHLTHRSWNFL